MKILICRTASMRRGGVGSTVGISFYEGINNEGLY